MKPSSFKRNTQQQLKENFWDGGVKEPPPGTSTVH